MWFNFKGYYEITGFELKVNPDIKFEKYKYLEFSTKEAQKAIYKFYKEEMQEGGKIKDNNTGRRYIEQTGFYEVYPKRASWEKFKNEFCPIIFYSFEIIDNIVWINPINVFMNKDICAEKNTILKL